MILTWADSSPFQGVNLQMIAMTRYRGFRQGEKIVPIFLFKSLLNQDYFDAILCLQNVDYGGAGYSSWRHEITTLLPFLSFSYKLISKCWPHAKTRIYKIALTILPDQ